MELTVEQEGATSNKDKEPNQENHNTCELRIDNEKIDPRGEMPDIPNMNLPHKPLVGPKQSSGTPLRYTRQKTDGPKDEANRNSCETHNTATTVMLTEEWKADEEAGILAAMMYLQSDQLVAESCEISA